MKSTRSNDTSPRRRGKGFTILELLVAVSIVGLLIAVAVPASVRFYDSIQYRQAVRDVVTTLASARYSAVSSGVAQDVALDPGNNSIAFNDHRTVLPDAVNMVVHSARELNVDRAGVIRFYPEGGSSGGDIDLDRADGKVVRISVDWLMGGVRQETYVAN
jgi:general secretion pathway protein H